MTGLVLPRRSSSHDRGDVAPAGVVLCLALVRALAPGHDARKAAPMRRIAPALVVSLLSIASLSVGCLAPTNPCDPGSSIDAQSEGTRLGGRVVDSDGNGVVGVTVTVLGLSKSAVSGDDGAWAIDDVPPSLTGYTVRAEPQAPASGGSLTTAPLGCQQRFDDVDLLVVSPLDAPEVELVQAVTPTSLLVAFGSGDADGALPPEGGVTDSYDEGAAGFVDVASACVDAADTADRAWRVQVRPPFDGWHDAVLNAFPWIDGSAAVDLAASAGAAERGDDAGRALVLERTDDVCAAALCAQFAYLESALSDSRARCANVVGFKDGDVVRPLEAFGSYEVRVLTERRVDPALSERFALPERVASAAPAVGRQMSLVPGSLLPLVDGSGAPLDGRGLAVTSVVTTSGGRFALVEPDGLRVLGGGSDVFGDANSDVAAGAPQNAVAEDAAVAENVDAEFKDGDLDAEALVALPAGDWLRVVKDSSNGASIEKVFIGASSSSGQSGPPAADRNLKDAAEANLPLSPSNSALGALRAVSYLDPGAAALVSEAANPEDAYLLLYRRGFVLIENGVADDLALDTFAGAADAAGFGGFNTDWADPDPGVAGASSGFGGDCDNVVATGENGAAFGAFSAEDDLNGAARTEVAVCYDVATATAEDVDLRDADVLRDGVEPLHLVADANNDRVMVASLSALRGQSGRLTNALRAVPVGRSPVALTHSRLLNCDAGLGDVATEVVLVANAGSGDVSVLRDDGGEVSEVAVAALPTEPAGFLDDVEGPTCADPFAWVIAADGRLLPLDMRGTPAVPQCGDQACAISSRGRARSGAVGGRSVGVASRALVGGTGLVGELGFFRPAALRGGAFLGSGDVADGVSAGAPAEP